MTRGTYPWPFVTQIFHDGQPNIGGYRESFEVLIGITDCGMWYQLRDIYSICKCCWNATTYKWEVDTGKF